MHSKLIFSCSFLTCVIATGCTSREGAVSDTKSALDSSVATTITVDLDSRRPAKRLSDYGLFADLNKQIPSPGVIPYEMNSTSYVDGAQQDGLIYVPPGNEVKFQSEGPFDFPVGTILVQNLRFPADRRQPDLGSRIVETRLLIHQNHGWTGVPYVWNDNHSDAERSVIGNRTDVAYVDADGQQRTLSYQTPNMNECKRCHSRDERMAPIGVTARNLNRPISVESGTVNQLQHWQDTGLLAELPSSADSIAKLVNWRNDSEAGVDLRARAWLDANCSHCHNPHGPAIVSGLDLSYHQDNPVRFGVYKPPVAAGRGSSGHRFSILPGEPDKSFLLHRVKSTELGVMMPPLGRTTHDPEGAALLREWIAQIQPDEALAEAALNPTAAYKDAVSGGDVERGKEIFYKTQKCVNCHRVGNDGGAVGPNLSDVGKRHKPEYLLESIVDPNAKIVEGFQTEVVMTADGRILTGVVVSEDEYEIAIADANDTYKIQKEDIEEQQKSPNSTMPTMANLLTVDQVADLIAYLVTLQDTPAP